MSFPQPLCLLFVVLVACAAGCMKDRWSQVRGTGFDERAKELTSDFPQREEAGKSFSFSTKARQIERDFGFD